MQPIVSSGAFSSHQFLDWQITHYNTPMTVPEEGIKFGLFSPSSTFSTSGMDGQSTSSGANSYISSNTTSVLSGGTVGRIANVVEYWDTGALPGIAKARYHVLHYSGDLTSDRSWAHPPGTTSSVYFGFAGKGYVQVMRNGSEVLAPTLLPDKSFTGTSAISVSNGDTFDIYYWQLGEQWGGFVCKYIAQPSGQGAPFSNVTAEQFREAPILSSSLLSNGAATSTVLSEVISAELEYRSEADVKQLRFQVPLVNQESPIGWKLLTNPRRLQYTAVGGGTTTLKKGFLIKFEGGFQGELYERFWGHILDFEESNGVVTISCESIESKMTLVHVANYPDRISYLGFGYIKDKAAKQPVYNIAAYDAWPLQYAIQDLCSRGKIDSKLLYRPKRFRDIYGSIIDAVDPETGQYQYKLSAKTISGELVRLQRPARYGRSGETFDSTRPADDQYIYRPDVSQSIIDYARSLSESLGYIFNVDGEGAIVLKTSNNPDRLYKLPSGGTLQYNPAAIKGKYRRFTTLSGNETTLEGSRIDIVVGKKSGLGSINYTVDIMSGTQVAAGSINLSDSSSSGVYFYDGRFSVDGGNVVVTTLYSGNWGKYTVTLDGSGTTEIDSFLIYDSDPVQSILPITLLTDDLVTQLSTDSNAADARNVVTVVGRRKTLATDSEKFGNNPIFEYYVSAGADPSSIWDPSVDNYVGGKAEAMIVDEKIADQDFADWAAKTLMTKYRDPQPSASLEHTILPFLEVGDCINAADQNFISIAGSVDLWITSISERYSRTEAKTSLRTTSYPPIASYDPREDISLEDLQAQYDLNPAINLNVVYPSLDNGSTITNPDSSAIDAATYSYVGSSTYIEKATGSFSVSSDGNGSYVDVSSTGVWPPIPDSITIIGGTNIWKNNPYMKFSHVFDYAGTTRIHVPFEAGDGGSRYTRTGGPWGVSGNVTVHFKGVPSSEGSLYGGASPFYDPYTSELPDGNLISLTFDALLTGYYRVSIWDARDIVNPTLIAWLTEPATQDKNPELHWQYITAGNNKNFLWDAVDSVGEWNQKQSETYADYARGWFEQDERPSIGRGFYVWNDKGTPVRAISDQKTSGKLTYSPDNYAQFLIKIECTNETLDEAAQTNSFSIGGVVSIDKDPKSEQSGGIVGILSIKSDNLNAAHHPKSSIFIYTHLPEPTKIKLTTVEDWDYTGDGAYDPETNATAGWGGTTPDSAATFRNDKPIRLTLEVVPRPGDRFGGSKQYTNIKVSRHVHLTATIMDQFAYFMGEPWTGTTTYEKKRIVSRRLSNAEHTVVFQDQNYRTGDSLDLTVNKWVFRPSDFYINEDPIVYGEYLQLEEVPGWHLTRTQGSTASRFIVGYISYVFYLSAYCIDRSGRRVWAIDDSFIDKSKITQHTFSTTFPEDLEQYSVRTIIARQWVKPDYVTEMSSQWNIPAGNQKYIQFFHKRLFWGDTDSGAALRLSNTGANVNGNLLTSYNDYLTTWLKSIDRMPSAYSTGRQLGDLNDAFFGDWTWEGISNAAAGDDSENIFWVPDITRDFHPYFKVPPMINQLLLPDYDPILVSLQPSSIPASGLRNWYSQVHIDATSNNLEDVGMDEAKFETWDSRCAPPWATGSYKFSNDSSVEAGPRLWEFYSLIPGHTWGILINENAGSASNGAPQPYFFDYQRQIEWLHWEDFRGGITNGEKPSRDMHYVAPVGGPYLLNTYKYSDITRRNRSGTYQAAADSEVAAGRFSYVVEGNMSTTAGSWYDLTFRHKYNWYSATYFPLTPRFELFPAELYPKWAMSPFATGSGWGISDFPHVNYDAGAWVGWKDDLAGSTLVWTDYLLQSATYSGGSGHNIFLDGAERHPIALGPKLTESKDVIINLVLVNSRRTSPV